MEAKEKKKDSLFFFYMMAFILINSPLFYLSLLSIGPMIVLTVEENVELLTIGCGSFYT